MKRLLLLLVLGTLGFLALAMAQEWEVFARALGRAAPPAPALAPEDAAAAERAVRELLALVRHLHGSGGDERFAERLPASEELREEIRADADWVRASLLRQDMDLVRLDVVAVAPLAPDRVEVRTREYWQVEWRSATGAPSAESRTAQVALGSYLVTREGERWIVRDWGPAAPDPLPAPAAP